MYNRLYGARARVKRRNLEKLKEKEKKSDVGWKVANLTVSARGKQQRSGLPRRSWPSSPAKYSPQVPYPAT